MAQTDDGQNDALAQPMVAAEAAHPLRRTGFAARAQDVATWTGRSWSDALTSLLDIAPDAIVPIPGFA